MSKTEVFEITRDPDHELRFAPATYEEGAGVFILKATAPGGKSFFLTRGMAEMLRDYLSERLAK